jgi:hypothetical protein
MKNIKKWYFSHACVYLGHGELQWEVKSKTWSQHRRHISEVPVMGWRAFTCYTSVAFLSFGKVNLISKPAPGRFAQETVPP